MKNSHAFPVVLVITPEKQKIHLLTRALKESFFVLEGASGQDGLDWLKSTKIDLIILDEKIQDFSVVDLLQKIRKTAGYAEIPLLLITGNLDKNFVFQTLNSGVSDFLRPTLDPLEVNQRIAVALKSREIEKKTSTLGASLKARPARQPQADLESRFLLSELALRRIAQARKTDLPLVLLLIEIDGFNDLLKKWGAETAQEISQHLHELLNKSLRAKDLLFPQGGGRFLLILPKTSRTAATEIAKSIQQEISSILFETKKTSLVLTLSIGIISFESKPTKEQTSFDQFNELLSRVSDALEKKAAGGKIIYKSL